MSNEKIRAILISSPMHTLLHEAIEKGGLTLERVLQIRQGTSGAIFKRGYLAWDENAKRGEGAFIPTPLGLASYELFTHAPIERKCTFRPLSGAIRDRQLLKRAEVLRIEYKEAWDEEQKREQSPRKGKGKRRAA